jgi:ubiquitin-conjugating enzyme E2 G1
MAQSSGAAGLLRRQLKYMQTAKDLPGISCGLVNDNVFEWEVMLMISDDCKYYGGESIPSQLLHRILLLY